MDETYALVGLVGLTLTISVGGWIDDARDWMRGFSVPANPLRILGEILSSTMAVGFCAGVTWAALDGRPWVLLWGGVVAFASAVADEALALMHGIVRRLVPTRMPAPMMPSTPMGPSKKKPEPGAILTEDQAHSEMDRQDDAAEGT